MAKPGLMTPCVGRKGPKLPNASAGRDPRVQHAVPSKVSNSRKPGRTLMAHVIIGKLQNGDRTNESGPERTKIQNRLLRSSPHVDDD
jgi:hypothetical protein